MKIRLLEIGAGTGGTSAFVLPALTAFGQSLEYHYTDLSPALVEHGRRTFARSHPFVHFQTLDIERAIEDQGLAVGSFDIVVASNVLHATRDMVRTLQGVKSLLVRGGTLVINELMAVHPFSTLTFGFVEGWWMYDDVAVRLPHSPLLAPETWRQLLLEAGFEHTHALGLPHGLGLERLVQQLWTASSDGCVVLQRQHAPLAQPSMPVSTCDLKSDAAAAVASAQPTAASSSARVRIEELEERVRRIAAQVLELPMVQLDPTRRFSDVGVDSIIGIRLVKSVNAELQLNLRTTVLFDYPTVSDLTGFILREYGDELAVGMSASTSQPTDTVSQPDGALRSVLERLAAGTVSLEEAEQVMTREAGALHEG